MSRFNLPTNVDEAEEMLTYRNGRKVDERTIANNTRLIRINWDSSGVIDADIHAYGIVHHSTCIVTMHGEWKGGHTVMRIDAKGWRSPTTKTRINDVIAEHGHVFQQNFEWYYAPKDGDVVPYYDGMIVGMEGTQK